MHIVRQLPLLRVDTGHQFGDESLCAVSMIDQLLLLTMPNRLNRLLDREQGTVVKGEQHVDACP